MTEAKQATNPEELERQIMSSVVPKNERENWACREIERLRHGLENCRLLAARNRQESWALLILGFCAEAGIAGNIMRDFPNADCHGPDWTDRDGEYLK